ncbi:succinate dehydrogenase assembly factor 2 [Magnetovibrio sp. PR-2]|uniref:FAD assembly factor SdhE n=1 Tax=Magnetovibrio sp. PR-2 TaxID=3120356 RepID=UPI002FCE1DA5
MDPKRKRLLYHCNHMGMKENDVMFGNFAEAHIETLTDADVVELEALLQNSDLDLFKWVLGKEPVPEQWNTALMKRLQDFNVGVETE